MANVDLARLQRDLASSGAMLTFLNDANPGDGEHIAALQQLGVHGFFPSYDARPDEPLDEAEAELWAEGVAAIGTGESEPGALARRIIDLKLTGRPVTPAAWGKLLASRGIKTGKAGDPVDATRRAVAGAVMASLDGGSNA